jgi:hypothetical protein
VPEHLDRLSDAIARDSSRRGFLARVGGALTALTAARTVGALIEPGDSEGFHFCGHTFTTGSCPHPTGLPRIDSRGCGRALLRLLCGIHRPDRPGRELACGPDGLRRRARGRAGTRRRTFAAALPAAPSEEQTERRDDRDPPHGRQATSPGSVGLAF